MMESTRQMNTWKGDFGKEYTDRNFQTIKEMKLQYMDNYGRSLEEIYLPFLGDLDRSINILEVGCNIGRQLLFLQSLGFKSLYGIELQEYAVEKAKSNTQGINIIQGSAFDIPYKDNYFDMVFTAGVLIHISPADIGGALSEIYRTTGKYIWGLEYYAEDYVEVNYRGNNELLWKTNFAKLYLDQFSGLKLVKEEKIKYLQDENVDSIYLLEKCS